MAVSEWSRKNRSCRQPVTRQRQSRPNLIERIASETTNITADTALRLSKALNTSALLWLNLQNAYDMQTVERELGKQLEKIKPLIADAA